MLKKIFRKPSREQQVIAPTLPEHLGQASEDDGFLVVGQTAVERTTVLPDQERSKFYVDLPPDYSSVVMGNSASQVNQSSRTATPIVVQPTTEAIDNLNISEPQPPSSSPSPWQSSQWQQPVNNGNTHLQPMVGQHSPSKSPRLISPRLPDELVPPMDGMAMLSGVPFKLSLALDRDTLSQFNGYSTLISEPLFNRYEYNFDLERSVKNS